MNPKLFSYSIILMLFCTSCVKQVDYKLQQQEQFPIAYCFLTPDSVSSCNLWYSQKVLNNYNTPFDPINNAQVFIYENGLLFDTLVQQQGSYYKGHSFPKMGASYSLKILTDNKELTASTSIPIKTKLDSVTIQYDVEYNTQTQFYLPQHILYIKDSNIYNNLFEFYYTSFVKDWNDSSKIIVYNDCYLGDYFGTIDFKIKDDVQIEYNPRSLLFTDKYFNGEITNIKFVNNSVGTYSALRTLSNEYYQYKQNYYAHLHSIELNNDGGAGLVKQILFSSEPIKMYSNIKGGGYGVFAGFSQDTVSTIIYK